MLLLARIVLVAKELKDECPSIAPRGLGLVIHGGAQVATEEVNLELGCRTL
jgi:hypothetical protein